MPALGKLQKKNKESNGIKMSVMANRTLSHSCNISVNDYQTGESNTHTLTLTNNVELIKRGTSRALIALKEPDDTDLEIKNIQ